MRNFAAINYAAKSRVSEVIDIGNKDTVGLLVEVEPNRKVVAPRPDVPFR